MKEALSEKAEKWSGIIKLGRTHMQDAVPMTLGQEFSGYAEMLSENINRLEWVLGDLYKLALGGTAVGTGINAPKGFAELSAQKVASITGLPFISAPNKFAAQGAHDALVMASGFQEDLKANELILVRHWGGYKLSLKTPLEGAKIYPAGFLFHLLIFLLLRR